MPPSGRPPSAAGQTARTTRPAPPDHRSISARGEKSKSAQQMDSPRKESVHSAHDAPSVAGLRPPNLKNRAHSAPMIPKNHLEGAEDDDAMGSLGDNNDDWEIAGDEFFQRYHFPEAVKPTKLDISSSSVDSSSDTEGPLSPTNLKGRHPLQTDALPSPRSPAPSVGSGNSDSASAMQDINVAVLGARGSGKSTFIRRALNLPNVGAGAVCTRKMTIDGGLYLVRFLEMSINDVQIRDHTCIGWPETVEDVVTPRIDGAVTIYDVTSDKSLARVPEILGQNLQPLQANSAAY
ncbi:hypothetical protein N0V90_005597 [Kalmusia sp. IMI 367209]|nr:hypothetical protein N0V90_005597 [Kalmusia sp. IMI 367209]